MNRLSVRLIVAFVGMTLMTVALLGVPQLRGIAAERVVLPVGERPVLTARSVGRALLVRGYPLQNGGFAAVLGYDDAARFSHDRLSTIMSLPRAAALLGSPGMNPWGGSAAGGADTAGGAGAATAAGSAGAEAADAEPTVPQRDIIAFLRASLEQRWLTLIGSASLALVLAAGLALLLARIIARPVESVTRATGRVAAGDLTVRIPVSAAGAAGSETARLARSFNTMADSLERLERNRKDMVADVAHELRTPLTVMRGRLEAMEDGVTPLDLAEVRDLHTQVMVLARLVEDLRVLSLADAGKLSLELQDVDLTELARSVGGGYQVAARERGIDLSVEAVPGVTAIGDRDRLTQVMANLLDNAVRLTPTGGSVTLVVTDGTDGPAFEVRDTGPGIPAGTERHIFERFVRTDESRARADGGSGLGLAIVNTIVELHNGTVRAWNSAAGGAVFSVQLER